MFKFGNVSKGASNETETNRGIKDRCEEIAEKERKSEKERIRKRGNVARIFPKQKSNPVERRTLRICLERVSEKEIGEMCTYYPLTSFHSYPLATCQGSKRFLFGHPLRGTCTLVYFVVQCRTDTRHQSLGPEITYAIQHRNCRSCEDQERKDEEFRLIRKLGFSYSKLLALV